jgi:hypothetical protein
MRATVARTIKATTSKSRARVESEDGESNEGENVELDSDDREE